VCVCNDPRALVTLCVPQTNRRLQKVLQRACRIVLASAAFLAATVALAQSPVTDAERRRDEARQRVEAVETERREAVERRQRIEAEIETIRRDRGELARRAIDSAERGRRLEAQITAAERRLFELESEQSRLRQALAGSRAIVAEVLAALQRLGRNPPPALFIEPDNALNAIRSAILMGAILPELRSEAEALVANLEQLQRVGRLVVTETERLRTELTGLAAERELAEALGNARRREQTVSEEELQRTRTRAEALARDARSLQDLLQRSEADITVARRAAEAAARAVAEREAGERRTQEARDLELLRRQDAERRTLASLPNPGRLQPAIAFERTRGLLPLPVEGERVRGFGDADGAGGTIRGVMLATRPKTMVTSPADGWVVFAGPFRAYGQLVIVNVGGGFHVLLAGMERTTVGVGQFVLAGEPVAEMGERAFATSTTLDLGSDRPVLYVEFRKDGSSIDPTPWWAVRSLERARG
jgi:murein hydrolase activator